MPPVGFEPTISADERPQTYALDRAATGTGKAICCWLAVYIAVVVLCVFCYLMCICCTVCVLLLFTLYAGLLARSQYSEGPATGHLDTGFSWFPCV